MAVASGLGDIFSCIKSSEELLIKKKKKLDDALAAISRERQRQAALRIEVMQRAAELERLQAQAAGLQTQLSLEERMADCLQTGLQKQQSELDCSKKAMAAATAEAEEAVAALEQLATSTHQALRLDGGRLLEGANRHRRLLQDLLLEGAALRCEVVLREDLLRDVLRVRCCAVAALRQLQRAVLRRQQLLRSRSSRQRQHKQQHQAREKQQQLQVQRLEAAALSVEDESLCLESLAAALRHELTRLSGASQTRRDRKEEAIRLCSTQPLAPASHLLHTSLHDQTQSAEPPVSFSDAESIGPGTEGLGGPAGGRGPEKRPESVAAVRQERGHGGRSAGTDGGNGNMTEGDTRFSLGSTKTQDYSMVSLPASCGPANRGEVIKQRDAAVKEPEGDDPWRDQDWEDVTSVPEEQLVQVAQGLAVPDKQVVMGLSVPKKQVVQGLAITEKQVVHGQTSRDSIHCDVASGNSNAASNYGGRQPVPGAAPSSCGATSSANPNWEYRNKEKTLAFQQQAGNCGNLDRSSSEITPGKNVITPSKKLVSAMKNQQAAVNAMESNGSNTGINLFKSGSNSQFNFKRISTSSVSAIDTSTYSRPAPTSNFTTVRKEQSSASSSTHAFNQSDTGSGSSSFHNSNARNSTHNPDPKGPQTAGNPQPKTVRFKFQKTSMIQLCPVKKCSVSQPIGNCNTGAGSLNTAANAQWKRDCRTKDYDPPTNISTAPTLSSAHQGNIKPLSQYNFQYRANDPQKTNSHNNTGAASQPGYPPGTRNTHCPASSNSCLVNQNQFNNQKESNRSFTSTTPCPPQQMPVGSQASRPVEKQTFTASPMRTSSTPLISHNAPKPQYRSSVGSAPMYDSNNPRKASLIGAAFQAPNHFDGSHCDISLPEPVTFTRDSCTNTAMPSGGSISIARGGVRGGRGVGRGAPGTRGSGAKRFRISNSTEVRDGPW